MEKDILCTVLNTKKHKNKDSIPEPSRTVSPNTIILEKARSNHSQKKRFNSVSHRVSLQLDEIRILRFRLIMNFVVSPNWRDVFFLHKKKVCFKVNFVA